MNNIDDAIREVNNRMIVIKEKIREENLRNQERLNTINELEEVKWKLEELRSKMKESEDDGE